MYSPVHYNLEKERERDEKIQSGGCERERESTRGRKLWKRTGGKMKEREGEKVKDVSIGVNAIEVLLKKASTLESK